MSVIVFFCYWGLNRFFGFFFNSTWNVGLKLFFFCIFLFKIFIPYNFSFYKFLSFYFSLSLYFYFYFYLCYSGDPFFCILAHDYTLFVTLILAPLFFLNIYSFGLFYKIYLNTTYYYPHSIFFGILALLTTDMVYFGFSVGQFNVFWCLWGESLLLFYRWSLTWDRIWLLV